MQSSCVFPDEYVNIAPAYYNISINAIEKDENSILGLSFYHQLNSVKYLQFNFFVHILIFRSHLFILLIEDLDFIVHITRSILKSGVVGKYY